MAESRPPERMIRAGHELRDLSPKHIAIFAGSLTLTVIFVFLVSLALMHHYYNVEEAAQPARNPLSFNQPEMPEPRLIVTPGEDAARLRIQEQAILQSYAWTNEEQGIARIPIDRAIEILAQKGLPVRSTNGTEANKQKASKGKESQNENQGRNRRTGGR